MWRLRPRMRLHRYTPSSPFFGGLHCLTIDDPRTGFTRAAGYLTQIPARGVVPPFPYTGTAPCRLLGVTHVYQLGYHDSGMAGWASNQERQAFVQAPLEDVTGRVVPLIRRHRPDVVVTYDAHGGYGHPDHIMAHRVTMASVAAAAIADRFPQGDALWQVRKVYAVVWPQSVVRRAIQVMRVLESCGLPTPLRELHVDPTVVGCPDALITTRIDVRSVLRAKWAALGAQRSQMGRLGSFVWLVWPVSRWLWPAETCQCVQSVQPIQPPEADMFAGLLSSQAVH